MTGLLDEIVAALDVEITAVDVNGEEWCPMWCADSIDVRYHLAPPAGSESQETCLFLQDMLDGVLDVPVSVTEPRGDLECNFSYFEVDASGTPARVGARVLRDDAQSTVAPNLPGTVVVVADTPR